MMRADDEDNPFRPEAATLTSEVGGSHITAIRKLPSHYRMFLAQVKDGSVSRRFHLESSHTVVGRGGADVELDDPQLSRKHFLIEIMSPTYVQISDLASRNGTYVNEVALQAVRRLSPGDIIRAGSLRSCIVVEHGSEPPADE